MYSRRSVALIFHGYEDVDTLVQRIQAAPTYIDRIYVLSATDAGDTEALAIAGVIASEPKQIIHILEGNATPVSLAAAYSQVIRDGFDLAVIVVGDSYFDYPLLPYLLDPIVWDEADFVKGVKHEMPAAPPLDNGPRMNSSYFIEQTRIFPRTQEVAAPSRFLPIRQGVAAVSHDGLEILWQELVKERFWRTLVAVPCYNEATMIASVVLRARAFVDDVLVVDDGSSDRTAVMAKEAGAIVIAHRTNLGYGAALRTCFEYSQDHGYDVMVILDGDGQHDPANIPEMLQKMKESGADIVIGSRFLSMQDEVPFYRRVGLKVLDKATNTSGGVPTTDTQCGYRAYGPKAIETIAVSDDSMGAGSEILAVAQENGLTVAEVPIRVRYDLKDTSSQNPVVHATDVLASIVWRMIARHPVLFVAVPGFLLTFGGLYSVLGSMLSMAATRTTSPEVLFVGLAVLILGIVGLFMGLTIAMVIRAKRS